MKPRQLRHRLEKAAKLLVVVQKHAPEVHCNFDADKGNEGHLILDFAQSGMSPSKIIALGKELESRDYKFTEKKSPWLGQITYTGRTEEKPTVLLTLPIQQDRLAINEPAVEKDFCFKEK
ncbi:MAG: hypothetical protein ACNA77_00700 [Opitutales bacterium]